jgi:type IV pilus assembly protein PilN
MMDLERVLPGGVQVTSIEPAITAEGDVNIRLRVSGQRDLAVDLVRNLERSQRFLAPHLNNETAQSQERGLTPVAGTAAPGGVEFEIMSGYNPLPASSTEREQENLIQKTVTDQRKQATPSGSKALANPNPAVNHPVAAKPKPATKHVASSHPITTPSSVPADKQSAKAGVP